jgi:hypothetical protein
MLTVGSMDFYMLMIMAVICTIVVIVIAAVKMSIVIEIINPSAVYPYYDSKY